MVLMHGLVGQKYRNATSRSTGHLKNNAHRVGEHLTQAEIGKLRQARELLAPVYGWFTKRFDKRDLKEAKALLNEMALSPS